MSVASKDRTQQPRPWVAVDAIVGRGELLRTLREESAQRGAVVTCWGPPGVGKTRVAFELLRGTDSPSPVFVAANTANDELSLTSALAAAVGVNVAASGALLSVVPAWTERVESGALIVLDGVDRVVPLIATWIDAMRSRRSDLRWLVTSREQLGVHRERVLRVDPLPSDEAVALLIARTTALGAERARESATELGEIVALLDGLPAAIELASPHVAILGAARTLDAIRARALAIVDPAQGRGLYAAIDASWQLLDAADQRALAALGTMRGSFDDEAARAVVGANESHTLSTLLRLVKKALLQSKVVQGVARFELAESVRAFAEHKAREAELWHSALAAHAAHFAERARRWRVALEGANPAAAIDAIRADRSNLLAAVAAGRFEDATSVVLTLHGWLEGQGPVAWVESLAQPLAARATEQERESEAGLQLAAARAEAARWVRQTELALSLATSARATALRLERWDAAAQCVSVESMLAMSAGEHERATDLIATASQLAARGGVIATQLRVANKRATIAIARGEHREAEQTLREALSLAERSRSAREIVEICALLGGLCVDVGRVSEAEALLSRAQRLISAVRDRNLDSMVAMLGAMSAHRSGQLELAAERYASTIVVARQLGAPWFAAAREVYLAMVQLEQGRFEGADVLLTRAREMLAESGEIRYEALGSALHAVAKAIEGDIELARAWCARAIEVASPLGASGFLPAILYCSAAVERCARDIDAAASARAHEARADEMAFDERTGRHRSIEACSAARILARCKGIKLAESSSAPIVCASDGAWVKVMDGRVMDLRRKPVLRALVLALVHARLRGEGARVSRDELQRAVWGELRMSAAVAGNRVRVALSSLRVLGLREVLRHDANGWWLSAECEIVDSAG